LHLRISQDLHVGIVYNRELKVTDVEYPPMYDDHEKCHYSSQWNFLDAITWVARVPHKYSDMKVP